MSFPRYERYKDSRVEWLDEVPAHWTVAPVRSIVQHLDKRNEGAECQDYLSLMANIGVMPYAEKGDVGNKKPEDLSKCKIVRRGNIVINSMNYNIGSYGMSNYDGVCSPVYVVLEINEAAILPRFGFRIFQNTAFQRYAASFGNGILAHRAAIGWDELKGIGIAVPPVKEQQAILSFLDDETAKIDVLIKEQQRLINLLNEKRQAVISHAVTKGLNPNVPMKNSGLEWIGTIPYHWEVGPIKRWFDTVSGGTPNTGQYDEFYTSEGGYPWIRTTDLNNSLLSEFEISISEEGIKNSACSVLPIGSVLVAMYGGPGTIGKNAILQIDATINQALCGLLPNKYFRPTFTFSYIQFYRPHWMVTAVSSRIDPNISQDQIRNAPILRPPLPEQLEIENYLLKELTVFDSLLSEAAQTCDLLGERRAALISAAVTGKIDVRSYTPKEAA